MTTAEFMIGRSVDDATERKQEVRKIGWALLAALVVHLVVGYAIAVSQGFFASAMPVIEQEKPMELTMVELPPPTPQVAPKKNSIFVETDESKQSAEPPKEKTFESNANSIAASQEAASGNLPLPSQQGKERPTMDLDTHAYSLPLQGAQPQPSAAPKESATPGPSVQPTSTPLPNQLAMLRSTPSPPPPSASKSQPSSSYRAMKEQTKIAGSVSNRGISSVNAMGTPLGRYLKKMNDAIGSRWYSSMERKGEMAGVGTVQVHFFIDRRGKVQQLKVTKNTSNETFQDICLGSIYDAHFEPIPEDLAKALPSEGLEMEEFTFILYPN